MTKRKFVSYVVVKRAFKKINQRRTVMPWRDKIKMNLLNQLSNWQLTQWQRAGRPGLDTNGHVADASKIQKFIELERRPSQ